MRPALLCVAGLFTAAASLSAQIEVRSDFEGGSLGAVTALSPIRLRCAVRGQSDREGRNRQANWYYFQLSRLPQSPITIDLVDLAGEYNYRGPAYSVTKGTRPVYSYDNVTWTHFSDGEVEWDAREPHLSLRFTPRRDRMWIAHVPPYSTRHLADLLAAVQSSPYLRKDVAGRTVRNREILLLTVTNSKLPEARKKVIWLMFRQHAWETGTSWVADGAVRFLLSDAAGAAAIRDGAIFKIFPMADPDGVASGAVRYNANGYDLNRNWDTIEPRAMPEIAAQHKAILDWLDAGHRLDVFLSLHNTESGEYLEAPRPFLNLAERIFRRLADATSFNPTTPLREIAETADRGRMTVDQGLFRDRKLPAMLMEQMVEYNSKLGRCPTVQDRLQFGAALVQVLSDAAGPSAGQ